MEFIDKLKSMGCETYKYTTEKTSKIAKETKLKMKVSQLKSEIEDIYIDIGKAIYENHIREEKTNIKEQIEQYCTQIDVLSGEIEEFQEELLILKNKRKCTVCAYEMSINDKFCPKCGRKQPEVEVKEAEIVTEEQENDNVNMENKNETMQNCNKQQSVKQNIKKAENNDEQIEKNDVKEIIIDDENEQESYANKENNKE